MALDKDGRVAKYSGSTAFSLANATLNMVDVDTVYTVLARGGYRYGFNNFEKDDEVKGAGNSVNYTYRMHDPRLGRFFAIDPLAKDFPWNSVYAFSENVVINSVELEGLERVPSIRNNRFNRGGLLTINSGRVRTLVVGSSTNFILSRPNLIPSRIGNPSGYIRPVPYNTELEPGVIANNLLGLQQDYQELDDIAESNPLFQKGAKFQEKYVESINGFEGEIKILHVDYFDSFESEYFPDALYITYSKEKDKSTMDNLRAEYNKEFLNFENDMYKAYGFNRGGICVPCSDQNSTVDFNIQIPDDIRNRVSNLFKSIYGPGPDRQLINDIKSSPNVQTTTTEIRMETIGNPD